MLRRTFIQNSLSWLVGILANLLPLKPSAAAWQVNHFANGEFSSLFQQLFGNQIIIDSDDINISLPEIAENGAVVPITINSELEHISKIYVWVEKNPTPLAAEIELAESVAVYLTARIKMAESCYVVVIAQQGNRLLRNQQWVKVMLGGCGTG